MVPPAGTKTRAVSGSRPCAMAAAVEAGSNDMPISTTPSFSICCWTLSFSGNASPLAPQVRPQRVVPRPERRRLIGEGSVGDGFCRTPSVGGQFEQRLLQEGRAHEVRRIGMGEAAGILGRPVDETGHRPRRRGHPCAVVGENEFRARRQGLSMPSTGTVKSSVAGRPATGRRSAHSAGPHEGAVQQVLLFHGEEVRPVDPDKIDRASASRPAAFPTDHAGDGLRGVAQRTCSTETP